MNSDMNPEFTGDHPPDRDPGLNHNFQGDHPDLPQYLEEMEHNNLLEQHYDNLMVSKFSSINSDRALLFPWETREQTYTDNPLALDGAVQTTFPWLSQFKELLTSVGMKPDTLIDIINRSGQVIGTSQLTQKKMIDVVADLLPQWDFTSLNQKAADVYTAAGVYRDEKGAFPWADLNQDYENATDEQKLVLSLATTKYILDTLQIEVSAHKRDISKTWATSLGEVEMKVSYDPMQSNLNLKVNLPQGGKLTWESATGKAIAERVYPGLVSLDLFDCVPGLTYPVQVTFMGLEQNPLTLGIVIQD